MKKYFILMITVFVTFSCKNTEERPNEVVDFKFIKEGELTLLKDNQSIKTIDIELALTGFEQQQGLMRRSSMKEDQGMLFIHKDHDIKKQKYWMKNCRFPLDILYIRPDSTVINIVKNAQPGDLDLPEAKENAKYVLELNGGMSDKWGVTENTKITWTALKTKK